jgi:hypothetical protein
MYPDQQPTQNYDFILNPTKPKRQLLFAPNSTGGKIGFIVGVLTLVVIILIGFNALISSSANKAAGNLTDLVAYQTELGRVIALNQNTARDQTLNTKSLTASYMLLSHTNQTTALLKARSIKISPKQLVKYTSKNNDTVLNAAVQANDFDAVYGELYSEKLTSYKTKLSAVYPSLSLREKAVIKTQSTEIKTLLGEPTTE